MLREQITNPTVATHGLLGSPQVLTLKIYSFCGPVARAPPCPPPHPCIWSLPCEESSALVAVGRPSEVPRKLLSCSQQEYLVAGTVARTEIRCRCQLGGVLTESSLDQKPWSSPSVGLLCGLLSKPLIFWILTQLLLLA